MTVSPFPCQMGGGTYTDKDTLSASTIRIFFIKSSCNFNSQVETEYRFLGVFEFSLRSSRAVLDFIGMFFMIFVYCSLLVV